MMEKALRLLHELNLQIVTIHLGMNGKGRYALREPAHSIIDEIKLYLAQQKENEY